MLFNGMSFEQMILLIPPLLFALCFHEFSHAYIAYKLGDMTAARLGRLTLNPAAHLDPIGSLMILFVGFGWAKPVPVSPQHFSDPRKGMMLVAVAGPAANLLLAAIGGLIVRIFYTVLIGTQFMTILFNFIIINIALCMFNMIPVYPLDGSQILSGYLIRKNPDLVYKIQRYGPQVLFGLIFFGMITNISIIWWVIGPFVRFFARLFTGI